MPKYVVTLFSKNEQALKLFFQYVNSNLKIQKFQTSTSYKKNKNKKQKIAVLKSPHVNKTAQEHFELRTYSLSMTITSYKIQKYMLVLKKIKNQLFPDIKIKIKAYFYTKNSINDKCVNPNNFKFQVFSFNPIKQTFRFGKLKNSKKIANSSLIRKKLIQKTVYKLKILDHYGKL